MVKHLVSILFGELCHEKTHYFPKLLQYAFLLGAGVAWFAFSAIQGAGTLGGYIEAFYKLLLIIACTLLYSFLWIVAAIIWLIKQSKETESDKKAKTDCFIGIALHLAFPIYLLLSRFI